MQIFYFIDFERIFSNSLPLFIASAVTHKHNKATALNAAHSMFQISCESKKNKTSNWS